MILWLLLLRRSWRSWWTTMIMAIYFRSSPSQFRIGPLSSWKSFKDTTTRLEGDADVLHCIPLSVSIPAFGSKNTHLNPWFNHRALAQGTSNLFLKPSKQTSMPEATWPSWHQMAFRRTFDARIHKCNSRIKIKKYKSKNKSIFINAHLLIFLTLVEMFLIIVSIEGHCFHFPPENVTSRHVQCNTSICLFLRRKLDSSWKLYKLSWMKTFNFAPSFTQCGKLTFSIVTGDLKQHWLTDR